jgi:hypothetical protein
MKKVVEIPKILAKFSVEDTKNHPKRPYRLRTSPARKGRKKPKKHQHRFFAEKNCFSDKVLCFCLPCSNLPVRHEWPSVVQASDASSYCTEVVAHATLSVLLVAPIWHVSGVAATMMTRASKEINRHGLVEADMV